MTIEARHGGRGELLLRFQIVPGDHLFGLGERAGAILLNGHRVENRVRDQGARPAARTSYSPVPLLVWGSNGALLLHTHAAVRFDIVATDSTEVRIAVPARRVRLTWIGGASLAKTTAQSLRIIGLPPDPPRWALGVWKSLLGGTARVQHDLARLRAASVPIDAVWLYDLADGPSGFGWHSRPVFDAIPPRRYRHPKRFIEAIHRHGVRVLGYLNPLLHEGSVAFKTAASDNYLLRDRSGGPQLRPWGGGGRVGQIDFTNPRAAHWFRSRVRAGTRSTGFDGAMQDFGEGIPPGAIASGHGDKSQLGNRWPLLYSRAVHGADPTAVWLARSGAPGTQSLATARFTGDQVRSWNPTNGLPSSYRVMVTGSLGGWPVWGPDIAGFTSADRTVTDEREIWLRWLQLGAFSPVMRDMLGDQRTGTVHALSSRETLAAFSLYARLHEALRPYLEVLARRAARVGDPIVRPPFLDSPFDPSAWQVQDEYLLGRAVVVAPVLSAGTRQRRAWLPQGRWIELWTGKTMAGGRWVTLRADRGEIPVLVAMHARAMYRRLRAVLPGAGIQRSADPR